MEKPDEKMIMENGVYIRKTTRNKEVKQNRRERICSKERKIKNERNENWINMKRGRGGGEGGKKRTEREWQRVRGNV